MILCLDCYRSFRGIFAAAEAALLSRILPEFGCRHFRGRMEDL